MSRELTGPDVIAGWGLANAVLFVVLVVFGEQALPIALYGGTVALIETGALVGWLAGSRHPDAAAQTRAPRRTLTSLLLAAIVALAGAGAVWDWWIALPAVYPALALLSELRPPAVPVLVPVQAPLLRQSNARGYLALIVVVGLSTAEVLRRLTGRRSQ
jgi:hypothetical protein